MSKTTERHPPSLIELGQFTAVIAPFLYIIGQKYATGYFNELGCAWVSSFLSFQETLNYALPTGLAVLAGAFVAYAMFSRDLSPKIQVIVVIGLPALIIAAVFASSIFWEIQAAKISSMIISIWLCMLFGFYAVEAIHTFRNSEKGDFKEASCWALSSAFTVFSLAPGIGSEMAEYDLKHIETRFPKIAESGVLGGSTEMRLIAKVGEKFLIMEKSGDTRGFYLKSNLDTLKILPMSRGL
ncbi:hypothetical protein ACIP66_23590 [Pseudomonas sp. NPDC088429]|uniref:hypothetical protein n=1 Tax=Pseudomonas sp. NPDC088429 TaxID=3364455 RepID=UPI003808C249